MIGFVTWPPFSFADTYLIRNKGGNVPGYSAHFSYVPELGLGKWSYVTEHKRKTGLTFTVLISIKIFCLTMQ